MRVRMFDDEAMLGQEAAALLEHHFDMEAGFPHAVMLSGGRTPLPIYRLVAASGKKAHRQLHLLLSDERFVPESSDESNYYHIRPLAEAMELPEGHFHRVHTETTVTSAARRYDHELETFFRQGGHLTLGLLGLGEDGHTASLFTPGDITRGVGKHAIPVHTASGPDRVSVTPTVLRRAERLVFIVAGKSKQEILARIQEKPETVVACSAVKGAKSTEIWYCSESIPELLRGEVPSTDETGH